MYERLPFAGLGTDAEMPKNYRRLLRRHMSDYEQHRLEGVFARLKHKYSIEWRGLIHANKDAEYKFPVNHYRALVNPAWEGLEPDRVPGTREDAVWHIPTKKYTKVSHDDAMFPLIESIKETYDDPENIFGTCRVRREGGEVHMDIFFKDTQFEIGGDELTFGISTGHDYYGNVRLYVDRIAYHDTGDGVGQIMRYITEPKRRKHTGEARDDVVEWYAEAIKRLSDASSVTARVVASSMDREIPIKDMPCTLTSFYEHLGLPNRGDSELADPAAERAIETTVGPYTAWHLYRAGMWAIEHHYESRDTSSFRKHIQAVNELLFNPDRAELIVLESLEKDMRDHPEDSEVWDFVDKSPSEETREEILDDIWTRTEKISDGTEIFSDTRERVRKMIEDEGVEVAETRSEG